MWRASYKGRHQRPIADHRACRHVESVRMFYEPGLANHRLAFDPFKSCVVPRSIGWISTHGPDGHDNLAPYRQFTNVGFDPSDSDVLGKPDDNRAAQGQRRERRAIRSIGWNMATWDLREAVNISAKELAPGQDEFAASGLASLAATNINVPRVVASPVRVPVSTNCAPARTWPYGYGRCRIRSGHCGPHRR